MIPTISPEDVKKAIDTKQSHILLDVRTPAEFSRGKLEGSINIPIDQIEENIESTIPDKQKTIYVYCLSGSRSEYAVNIMIKKGYTNVYDIPHGVLAWRAKGYSLS